MSAEIKLSLPLRAEAKLLLLSLEQKWYLYDSDDKFVCECPNKETATAIVAMSEDAKRLRDALRQVKLHCLTTKQSGQLALAHIIRICIDAGIREKLNADNTDLDKAALAAEETK